MMRIRGLALAAFALAAMAVAPAAASAGTGFAAIGGYPVTVHGDSAGEVNFRMNGYETFCDVSFERSLEEHTATLTSGAESAACYPQSSLDMEGCHFELDPAGAGSLQIAPSGCGPAELQLPNCNAVLEIPAQDGIPVQYENVGSGSETRVGITLDSYLEYTIGSNLCGQSEGTHENLLVQGELELTATDDEEASRGLYAVTGGLYVGEGAEGGQFEAAEYPGQVSGEQLGDPYQKTELVVLDTGEAGKAVCSEVELDGGEMSAAQSSLSLGAAFSGCTFRGIETEVGMSSCRYVMDGLEYAEGEATATPEIACDAGDAISLSLGGCVLTIPPQTLGGGKSGYQNVDLYREALLLGLVDASGVEYISNGAFVCQLLGLPGGAYENGGVELPMLLRGQF